MYRIYADNHILYSSDVADSEYYLFNPVLKTEIGKVSSLSFSIHPEHPEYDYLQRMKTIIRVEDDYDILFKGRILDWSRGMMNDRHITAEDALAYLNDGWFSSTGTFNETITAFFTRCINAHNATCSEDRRLTIGTVSMTEADEKTFEIQNPENVMDILSNQLLSVYGGYLRTRHTYTTTYIDYIQKYNHPISQQIRFANNLINLDENQDGSDLFTALVPVGKDNLMIGEAVSTGMETLSNGVEVQMTAGKNYILVPSGAEKYGLIYKIENFNNVEDSSELLKEGKRFVANNYVDRPEKFSIRAIDMTWISNELDRIRAGDTVEIVSFPHGVNDQYLCTAVSYGLENIENTLYEFSDPNQQSTGNKTNRISDDMSDSQAYDSQSSSDLATLDGKTKQQLAILRRETEQQAEELQEQIQQETSARQQQITRVTTEWNGQLTSTRDELTASISLTAEQFQTRLTNTKEGLESTITQTAASIRLEVKNTKEGLESSITVTAASIRAEVKNTKEGLESSITVTAASIRAELKNTKEGLESSITVTAASIRSEVKRTKEGLESSITQTATSIRAEVANTAASLRSSITVTAASIRSEVTNTAASLRSSITQTATSIRSEVANTASNLQSSITQTATSIRSEVSNVKKGLQTSITQTATSIRSEVSNTASNLRSSITQTASSIRSEIASTASSLRSSITQTADSIRLTVGNNTVEINSMKTRLKKLEADYVDADYVSSQLSSGISAYFSSLSCTSLDVGGCSIGSTTLVGVSGSTSSSGTTQLVFTHAGGYTSTYNFSGASSVTLSGSWSGATYTVTASNGKTKDITITGVYAATSRVSGTKNVKAHMHVLVDSVIRYIEPDVELDASDVYDNGRNSVGLSSVTVSNIVKTGNTYQVYVNIGLQNGKSYSGYSAGSYSG